jgi:hypothetical protein
VCLRILLWNFGLQYELVPRAFLRPQVTARSRSYEATSPRTSKKILNFSIPRARYIGFTSDD